jgi:hypothetical protein
MLNENFNLKSIQTNNTFYTPNGENPNLTIHEVAGNYVADADGIFNTLNAALSFNGNSLTLNDYGITLQDCLEPNCYYEDLYFYDVLTTLNLDSKTFNYYYNENNGFKYLRLHDSNNNIAYYSTEPAPEPNPMLFQTWYLFMTEADLGDPFFYDGPNPPQITINPDFTYTGTEGCALINGDFILGNADEYYEFILQSRNYSTDETNCPPGSVDYAMWELQSGIALGSIMYEGSNGNDYLQYEIAPGFISHFTNVLLSIPDSEKNSFSLYPNPANDKLFLKSSESNFSISITDINGRIVKSILKTVSNEIDISALKSGMYFITIGTSEGNSTRKFIKN